MGDEARNASVRFVVGWGDLDANQHLANTAILDHAADTRVTFFARCGFPGPRFAELRIGPVIVRDELVYRKELRLMDEYTVDLVTVGLSPDGVRFAVENTFRNAASEVTAIVTSEGLWFDLDRRKPRIPPPDLDAAMRSMPRGDRYRELPSRPPAPAPPA